jgi:hypothetical protein
MGVLVKITNFNRRWLPGSINGRITWVFQAHPPQIQAGKSLATQTGGIVIAMGPSV